MRVRAARDGVTVVTDTVTGSGHEGAQK